jgi:hypothetical protein
MSTHSRYKNLISTNRKLAKQSWSGLIGPMQLRSLTEITRTFGFSIASGDLMFLTSGWYVTHTGLIGLAKRRYCAGINVEALNEFCDPIAGRWAFKATAYTSRNGKGFVGHGDADPSNVSPLVRGAEMRIAETRAVNRALRKAYGIGLCSVEELGWSPKASEPAPLNQAKPLNGNGHSNGQTRLRDQLCLLIRQYNLDPNLVKAYAAHFCGTEALKDASRDLVESFISHLAASAKEDIDGLICKLNSFSRPVEVKQ